MRARGAWGLAATGVLLVAVFVVLVRLSERAPHEAPRPESRGTLVRVVDSDGRPVPGARVVAWSSTEEAGVDVAEAGRERTSPPTVAHTSADGTVSLTLTGPHAALLATRGDGSSTGVWPIVVPEGPHAPHVELVLMAAHAIEGVVREEDGQPVAHAVVRFLPSGALRQQGSDGRGIPVSPPPTETNADGRFRVACDPRWEGQAVAEAHGRTSVAVRASTSESCEIRIADLRLLRGLVLGPDDAPVADADVYTGSPGRSGLRTPSARSDADGRFVILLSLPGRRVLQAVPGRLHAGELVCGPPVAVDVDDGTSDVDVVLALRPSESIEGTVVRPDGSPAAGVYVRATRPEGPRCLHVEELFDAGFGKGAMSDETGGFRIEGLLPTIRYTLEAGPRDEPWMAPRPGVTAGARELVLEASDTSSVARLVGTVIDAATGRPAERFQVTIWEELFPFHRLGSSAGAREIYIVDREDGRFVVDRLKRWSRAGVRVELPDRRTLVAGPIDLTDEVMDLRFEVGADAMPTVLVRAPAGTPLVDARVQWLAAEAPEDVVETELRKPLTLETGADGRATFAAVPPGDYLLQAFDARLGTTSPRRVRLDRFAQATFELTFDADPARGTLTVVATRRSGAPLVGASVTVNTIGGLGPDREVTTDAEGRVTLSDLEPGLHVVSGQDGDGLELYAEDRIVLLAAGDAANVRVEGW